MTFTATQFQPQVDTLFSVELPERQETILRLESVEDSAVQERDYRSFSLFFTDVSDTPLPQATYRLRHPQLGEQYIFLVPIAKIADGHRYQACFTVQA